MSIITNDVLNSLISNSLLNNNNNLYILSIQPVQLPNINQLLSQYTVNDVINKLQQYTINNDDIALLAQQEVDGSVLPAVANDDVLQRIGITTFGRRQRIVNAINNIIRENVGIQDSNSNIISNNNVNIQPVNTPAVVKQTSTATVVQQKQQQQQQPSAKTLSSTTTAQPVNNNSKTTNNNALTKTTVHVSKSTSGKQPTTITSPTVKSNKSSGFAGFSKSIGNKQQSLDESKEQDDDYHDMKQSNVNTNILTTDDDTDTEHDIAQDKTDIERSYQHPRVQRAAANTVSDSATTIISPTSGQVKKVRDINHGAQFMAERPWLGAIVEPSSPPANNPSLPDKRLELEWIHGYRAFDSRSNLVYNTLGQIIYPTAAVCVVYDTNTHKQHHYMGHTDDIRCLTQSPANPNIIASGQNATIIDGRGTNPLICVWDSTDFSQSIKLKLDTDLSAVRSLSFSADGKYIACVCDDDNHTVNIYEWACRDSQGRPTPKLRATAKGDQNVIYQIKWNTKDNTEFITVGKRHIVRWTWDDTKPSLVSKRMSFATDNGRNNTTASTLTYYSITYSEKGYACIGSDDGSIYIFVNGKLAKIFNNIHKSRVLTLDSWQGGLITGGSDGIVNILDKTMNIIKSFKSSGHIQSVQLSNSNNVLIGTSNCEVFHLSNYSSIQSDNATPIESQYEPITSSHNDGELWGLSVAGDGEHYVSVGEDNEICIWNHTEHKLVKRGPITNKQGKKPKVLRASTTSLYPPNQCARAVAISPDGQHIIVGCNDGALHIYESSTLNELYNVDLNSYGKVQLTNQHNEWIQVIQYNPQGSYCAVGTHGSVICILDIKNGYKVVHVFKSHNSFITHIDWSVDGYFIQSTCGAYELLFHKVDLDNINNSHQITSASDMSDIIWHTQTCQFGWPVQGVYNAGDKGEDIQMCDASNKRDLLVTADDYGKVNLFRYPCLPGNPKLSFSAHSSHVVSVKFTADDKYVISTGGHDLAIAVWRVV